MFFKKAPVKKSLRGQDVESIEVAKAMMRKYKEAKQARATRDKKGSK